MKWYFQYDKDGNFVKPIWGDFRRLDANGLPAGELELPEGISEERPKLPDFPKPPLPEPPTAHELYIAEVQRLIREKYSVDSEFELVNLGIEDSGHPEYIQYRKHVEEAKATAKKHIGYVSEISVKGLEASVKKRR